eukprot:gene12084-15195_t
MRILCKISHCDHSRSQGDVVLLTPGGESPDDSSVEAVVLDYSTRWIRVALPPEAASTVRGGGWRIDMFANTTSYERSHGAVKRFSTPPGNDEDGSRNMNTESVKDLLRMLTGTIPAGGLPEQEPSSSSGGYTLPLPHSLARPSWNWKDSHPAKGSQVLATAASNVAVDNLVSGLLDLGVKVVRVGQPAKIAPELRDYTLEALVAKTEQGKQAISLRVAASKLTGSECFSLIQQAMQLEATASQAVLSSSQVVACTCIGAGDPRLAERSFPLCVLDEACQATEPSSIVAMVNQVQSLLLVGDPQQLPPTVKSRDAEGLGLTTSIFSRLMKMGMEPMLLDTQYRMHPSICEFPSLAFYGGQLKSFPKPKDRPQPEGILWPSPKVSVCMVAVQGEEKRTNANTVSPQAATALESLSCGFSYMNDMEAQEVIAVVMALLRPPNGGVPLQASDIGVVTPYNGQVRHIQACFQRQHFWDPEVQSDVMASLEIKSVDGFQGREKEVIIFSTVRSNTRGHVGFLSDYRRLNVAVTRAKRGLVVIGNPTTLKNDPIWSKWLKWALEKQIIIRPTPKPGQAPPSHQAVGGKGGRGKKPSRSGAPEAETGAGGRGRMRLRAGE